MTSERWPLLLAAALGAAWALLAHAPASWIAHRVAAASGQHLLLCDATGDWRDASARVVLSAGPQGREASVLPGTLHWHVDLGGLWRGGVGLNLRWPGLADTPLQLRADAGVGAWGVRQISPQPWRATLPARLLAGIGTPWNTVAPQGQLQLELRDAALATSAGRTRWQGALRLQARDMSSRLSTLAPLGSYQLDLLGSGGGADIRLRTLSGALVLDGSGSWNGQQLQFAGTARAAPGHEQALRTLLGLLGQRDGDHVRIGL